jgi:nitroreductase
MEFDELIIKRQSIRKFKPDPVSKEMIMEILEAARIAPSGGNRQPWQFIVVQNKEMIKKLAGRQEWAATAPVMILGLVDKGVQASYYYNDMGIAFEHIILKATDLGLGTCWMGMMRRSDEARVLLDIPKELEVIIQTPIGYPDETPNRRGRKKMGEIVSWERYGNRSG